MERNAIDALLSGIDHKFSQACTLILQCSGRVVVTGMGKSGHIGTKIAATLASTGTPAFFVHPGEASHGDLGMITSEDVVIAISNSGSTSELLTILPLIKRKGSHLISMTGDSDSQLARQAHVNLDISVGQEACPMNLAPTSSTTATLVMGDAIAVALLEARDFKAEDFAFHHPGGSLGRRLLLKVSDLMHTGDALPRVKQHTSLADALLEVSRKRLGMTAVVDEADRVIGIFTDGDLRRAIDQGMDIHATFIHTVMTTDCVTVLPDVLAAKALKLMEDDQINGLLIINSDNTLIGAVNSHDFIAAKIL